MPRNDGRRFIPLYWLADEHRVIATPTTSLFSCNARKVLFNEQIISSLVVVDSSLRISIFC